MLAALLFAACSCLSHDPLFTTPGMAQDSTAVYRPLGASVQRIEKSDGRISYLLPVPQVVEQKDLVSRAIDVDGALLYFATNTSLKAVSVFGGPPVDLAEVVGFVAIIHHDAAAIYWAEPASGRIRRIDKRSGVIDTVVDGLVPEPWYFSPVAFDEHSIFTTALNSGVVRVDKSTGVRTQMTPPLPYRPPSIFVDGTNIYIEGASYMPKSGGPLVTFNLPGKAQVIAGVAGGRLIVSRVEVPPHDPFGAGMMVWYLDAYDLCSGTSTRVWYGEQVIDFAVDTCAIYPHVGRDTPFICLAADSYIDSIDPPQASAAGGTLLTINGKGFSPDARVSIGPSTGTEFFTGTGLSVTPSRITVLSPPAFAGAALLRVSDGRQCTSTPYVIVPAPRREAAAH